MMAFTLLAKCNSSWILDFANKNCNYMKNNGHILTKYVCCFCRPMASLSICPIRVFASDDNHFQSFQTRWSNHSSVIQSALEEVLV